MRTHTLLLLTAALALPASASAQIKSRADDAFGELDQLSKLWPVQRTPPKPVRPTIRPPLRPPIKTRSSPPKTPPKPPLPPVNLDDEIDFSTIDHARMDQAIRDATNAARAKHRLPPLLAQANLTLAARGHAQRMSEAKFFNHDDTQPATRTPMDRARRAGVRNPKIAENIALRAAIQHDQGDGAVYVRDLEAGHFSRTADGPIIQPHTYASFAEAIVQQWMDSPGHRRNILAAEALEIGCAVDFVVHGNFPSFNAVQVFQWYEPVDA